MARGRVFHNTHRCQRSCVAIHHSDSKDHTCTSIEGYSSSHTVCASATHKEYVNERMETQKIIGAMLCRYTDMSLSSPRELGRI